VISFGLNVMQYHLRQLLELCVWVAIILSIYLKMSMWAVIVLVPTLMWLRLLAGNLTGNNPRGSSVLLIGASTGIVLGVVLFFPLCALLADYDSVQDRLRLLMALVALGGWVGMCVAVVWHISIQTK
jgi:hypothetical protein